MATDDSPQPTSDAAMTKKCSYQSQMGTPASGRGAFFTDGPSSEVSAGVDNRLFHKGTVDQATSLDQRRFRRYGIKLPCHIKPRASGKSPVLPELIVETLDVSGGGLFFLASAAWPVGTDIEFELDIATQGIRRRASIQCQGTITRVVPKEEGRVGIGATIDHYKISTLRNLKYAHDQAFERGSGSADAARG